MLKSSTRATRIRRAWAALAPRERQMFALLFYQGLTPTEAAVAMGCSPREVKRVVEQRLEKLRRLTHPSKTRRSLPRPRVTAVLRKAA